MEEFLLGGIQNQSGLLRAASALCVFREWIEEEILKGKGSFGRSSFWGESKSNLGSCELFLHCVSLDIG